MRNSDQWQPSKYVLHRGRLRASRDRKEVGVGSRLNADLVAQAYEEALPRYARGRLLDLGCGKVPLYLVYRSLVKECVCVDWGNSIHTSQFLDRECDLTQPLPFADGEFDTIILSDVLEHLPQPELLWSEMKRMLAPGGHILLNTPFYYWLHEEPHDYYRYTQHALRRFVRNVELELLELKPVGGAPEVLADIAAKNLLSLGEAGKALAAFVQWSASCVRRTRLGRKISDSTQDSFPLGYMAVAKRPALSA